MATVHPIPTGTRFINMTGQRFGHLVVSCFAGKNGRTRWNCRCDCGAETIVASGHLRNGHTQSCGCFRRQETARRKTKHGGTKNRHQTPEFRCWVGMRQRCYNQNCTGFKYWGGKGVAICARWNGIDGFANFLADMGPKPTASHSIDRINSDGNYEPGNCRWATRKEQNRNTRQNRRITYAGKTQCLKDWAIELGMTFSALQHRLNDRGWSVHRAFTTPVRPMKRRSG